MYVEKTLNIIHQLAAKTTTKKFYYYFEYNILYRKVVAIGSQNNSLKSIFMAYLKTH